jgi:UDP-galactopyranose mutase
MLHVHGPHIFHTDQERVWRFVNRFSAFKPYIQRTKTTSQGRVYSLPLNLLTINQLFGLALRPAEAAKLIESLADKSIAAPANFEEQALAFLGDKLYRAFFYGYTKKQWGCEPRELPAGVLKRLPVRFNYDDNYFSHPYQGMPEHGYTRMVENMLDHPGLTVTLGRAYEKGMKSGFGHVFYTGPLDRYFEYPYGRLPYRTLRFEWFAETGDYQGCPVMNYADQDVPHTRIIEHKHFTYWETFDRTVCSREIPGECGPGDAPYYPIRFAADNPLLDQYQALARTEENVTFAGRLGTFRYLDMDQALGEALAAADRFLGRS